MSLADNGVWNFHIHRPSMSLRGELVARGELVLAGLYPCLISRHSSFFSKSIHPRTHRLEKERERELTAERESLFARVSRVFFGSVLCNL